MFLKYTSIYSSYVELPCISVMYTVHQIDEPILFNLFISTKYAFLKEKIN